MKLYNQLQSNKLRTIALAVAVIFTLEQAAFAAPELSGPAPVIPAVALPVTLDDIIRDPSKIDFPMEHVTVKEIHAGTSGKLFIHIQDAHSNYSGQMSLAMTLDHFMNKYKAYLVLAEGSDKDVTLDDIRAIADEKSWKIVGKKFLMDGIINGEEYLNLTASHPMKIRGLEYQDLYDKSLEAYANLVDVRKSILLYIHQIRNSHARLKNKLYPEMLLAYEEVKAKNDREGDMLLANVDMLLELAERAEVSLEDDYPETRRLTLLREEERQIDFQAAGAEQQRLIAKLSSAGLAGRVRAMIRMQKKSKNTQASQRLMIGALMSMAEEAGVDVSEYETLLKYGGYLRRFLELKADVLLGEIERLEDQVYSVFLTASDDAKKLRLIDRYLGLLHKAYSIKLSSDEFRMLAVSEKAFPTASWEAFLNEKLKELGYYEDLIPYRPFFENASAALKEFYGLVDQRDEAFLQNAQRIMHETGQRAAYLIAGGYHTARLTRLFRQAGASYVVLTPMVEAETDHGRYEDILLSPLKIAEREAVASGETIHVGSAENTLRSLGLATTGGRLSRESRIKKGAKALSKYLAISELLGRLRRKAEDRSGSNDTQSVTSADDPPALPEQRPSVSAQETRALPGRSVSDEVIRRISPDPNAEDYEGFLGDSSSRRDRKRLEQGFLRDFVVALRRHATGDTDWRYLSGFKRLSHINTEDRKQFVSALKDIGFVGSPQYNELFSLYLVAPDRNNPEILRSVDIAKRQALALDMIRQVTERFMKFKISLHDTWFARARNWMFAIESFYIPQFIAGWVSQAKGVAFAALIVPVLQQIFHWNVGGMHYELLIAMPVSYFVFKKLKKKMQAIHQDKLEELRWEEFCDALKGVTIREKREVRRKAKANFAELRKYYRRDPNRKMLRRVQGLVAAHCNLKDFSELSRIGRVMRELPDVHEVQEIDARYAAGAILKELLERREELWEEVREDKVLAPLTRVLERVLDFVQYRNKAAEELKDAGYDNEADYEMALRERVGEKKIAAKREFNPELIQKVFNVMRSSALNGAEKQILLITYYAGILYRMERLQMYLGRSNGRAAKQGYIDRTMQVAEIVDREINGMIKRSGKKNRARVRKLSVVLKTRIGSVSRALDGQQSSASRFAVDEEVEGLQTQGGEEAQTVQDRQRAGKMRRLLRGAFLLSAVAVPLGLLSGVVLTLYALNTVFYQSPHLLGPVFYQALFAEALLIATAGKIALSFYSNFFGRAKDIKKPGFHKLRFGLRGLFGAVLYTVMFSQILQGFFPEKRNLERRQAGYAMLQIAERGLDFFGFEDMLGSPILASRADLLANFRSTLEESLEEGQWIGSFSNSSVSDDFVYSESIADRASYGGTPSHYYIDGSELVNIEDQIRGGLKGRGIDSNIEIIVNTMLQKERSFAVAGFEGPDGPTTESYALTPEPERMQGDVYLYAGGRIKKTGQIYSATWQMVALPEFTDSRGYYSFDIEIDVGKRTSTVSAYNYVSMLQRMMMKEDWDAAKDKGLPPGLQEGASAGFSDESQPLNSLIRQMLGKFREEYEMYQGVFLQGDEIVPQTSAIEADALRALGELEASLGILGSDGPSAEDSIAEDGARAAVQNADVIEESGKVNRGVAVKVGMMDVVEKEVALTAVTAGLMERYELDDGVDVFPAVAIALSQQTVEEWGGPEFFAVLLPGKLFDEEIPVLVDGQAVLMGIEESGGSVAPFVRLHAEDRVRLSDADGAKAIFSKALLAGLINPDVAQMQLPAAINSTDAIGPATVEVADQAVRQFLRGLKGERFLLLWDASALTDPRLAEANQKFAGTTPKGRTIAVLGFSDWQEAQRIRAAYEKDGFEVGFALTTAQLAANSGHADEAAVAVVDGVVNPVAVDLYLMKLISARADVTRDDGSIINGRVLEFLSRNSFFLSALVQIKAGIDQITAAMKFKDSFQNREAVMSLIIAGKGEVVQAALAAARLSHNVYAWDA